MQKPPLTLRKVSGGNILVGWGLFQTSRPLLTERSENLLGILLSEGNLPIFDDQAGHAMT